MKALELATLQKKLGHEFLDQNLLQLALTHRSFGCKNNERLEFLGDSIVNFVIAEMFYSLFPDAKEGRLSRLRARMVRGSTLAELGREFELGDYLSLGSGELKSGGFRRDSILADAVEAIIGAIYLDAGMAVCQACVRRWFTLRIDQLIVSDEQIKDPKTRLQEYLQARHEPLPIYEVISIKGEAHDQHFSVVCTLGCLEEPSKGEGPSRRGAEQQAARYALKRLGADRVDD